MLIFSPNIFAFAGGSEIKTRRMALHCMAIRRWYSVIIIIQVDVCVFSLMCLTLLPPTSFSNLFPIHKYITFFADPPEAKKTGSLKYLLSSFYTQLFTCLMCLSHQPGIGTVVPRYLMDLDGLLVIT